MTERSIEGCEMQKQESLYSPLSTTRACTSSSAILLLGVKLHASKHEKSVHTQRISDTRVYWIASEPRKNG